MNGPGGSKGTVRIRLMGSPEPVYNLAAMTVMLLEKAGFEVIEWSQPYPCKAPDEDKNRIYLTAVKKGAEDGNGS